MGMDSRGTYRVALICLLAGAVLTGVTWYGAIRSGHLDLKAAMFGPIGIACGLGLVLGAQRAREGASRISLRCFGLAGAILGLMQLWVLGFFGRKEASVDRGFDTLMLAVFVGMWFLPERLLWQGGKAPSTCRPRQDDPIEPS